MKRDRRDPGKARLRIYMDEMRRLREMTNEEYAAEWAKSATADTKYVSRGEAIEFIAACIYGEVNRILEVA